ncbi:hypothetical protein BX661DRAFT_63036 [Kickxella alabastrina]|uniref:uncharacterized protein n=1 Tax=Kickxella alabastrina TaxID=61397 RepID=UPI00221E5EF4|nr:uncharacterized protein BX661DRAFT_63036 [Kickxella alabastrina]KAI7821645.1 hypothetical protein BX661DRAFT_63036 [Kickxella alabastrina]
MTELANVAAAAVTSTRPHQFQAMELRLGDVSQATNTAELIKLIRKAGDALDQGMREPSADYFAPKLEALRADCLELFRRLLLRNPYSSYRKDVVSKLWFRTIYPSIEQYRANIKQFESLVGYAAKRPVRDAMDARKEVSRWRAQFQCFLQASTGVLLRIVVELAETNELVALGHLVGLSEFAVDYRALATHAYGFEFVDGLQSELHPALSPAQRASLAIISKLLIYLGDLSRYRILYTSKKQGATSVVKAAASRQPQYASGQVINGAHEMWWPAKNFYRGAIKLAPHRGQPQNQLAVVYGYEKNSLDGVFCYYRALTAMHTFPPAEANLRTILENALRAIEDTGADAADAGTTGYLYYENCVYQKFTHLRYLFAIHQPTVKELAALAEGRSGADRVSITPEMERQLINDVLAASARFIQGVKSGSIDQRQILVTQAIHIFELQQLCALGADDTESTLHSASVARLSALLAMKVAENLSFAVRCSIIDVLHHPGRMREVKSEADLLSKSSRRAIPPLIQTLLWIVSASVRVVRDAISSESLGTSGSPLVSLLRQKVFAVIKDCNLLDNVNALRSAMEQVQSKVNRRTAPVERVTWRQVLGERLMAPLTQRLWFYGTDDRADISGTGVEDSLRLEEELFVGWRLPDGTVWGKGAADQGALVYKMVPNPAWSQSPRARITLRVRASLQALHLSRQMHWLRTQTRMSRTKLYVFMAGHKPSRNNNNSSNSNSSIETPTMSIHFGLPLIPSRSPCRRRLGLECTGGFFVVNRRNKRRRKRRRIS